ncbi:LysM peptidoglycan-binding domain-containing protein [Legionella sp. km772]|nr:LysM peptidoglycan-binding domain-containing protein [Legionella sp. km772]
MITFKFLVAIGIYIAFLNPVNSQTVPDVWDVLRNEFSISHEVTRPEVQEQIRWLAAHPSYLNKVSRQSEPYIYHIVTQIKKRRLPGELALLPMIESAYDPFAYSGAGAAGLWQLMPKTGSELGLKQDWWFDGRRSIGPSTDAALNYLVYLNNQFNGSWNLTFAAYDSGEGTVSRAIKALGPNTPHTFWNLTVPQETRVYVPRLLALAEVIKNPARYHISLTSIPYLPYFEEVNIGSQIDLSHAARMAGISYKELIKLNPGYNRWTTAPYKPFKLLIPAEKVEMFNLNLSNVPEEKRVSWTKHRVQRGDNLNNIAVRYHTTPNLLKQVNQLNSNAVQPNQSILIPSTRNTTVVEKTQETNVPPPVVKPLTLARTHRVIHIVQANDSYQQLQKLYGVSAKEIQAWNKLSAYQALRPGQQLLIWKKIKPSVTYSVKTGDTLSAIARNHNTSINSLIKLNPGLNPNIPLRPGQQILVG